MRREVPEKSVSQIILILELEHRIVPGVLKRSTLERHLYKAGFGAKHLKTYKEARESSSKRFCKPHRMMLIQGDIKYGPKLPIGKNGAKVQTYLSSAIDDHSRFVIASKFYDNCEETIVEDTPSLPAAIQAMDKPETSRLLDGLEKRHRESKTVVADAISFADYRREGKDNV